jgi:NAD+ synthase (glutamine-hydrolysing)
MSLSFDNLYAHGLIRAAIAVPRVRVADVAYNTERTIALAQEASRQGAAVAAFPELGLTAYTNDDLFHQDALLDRADEAIGAVARASRALVPVIVVGAPVRVGHHLYNCAVVIHDGHVLGVVPKSYLPNYREYYEKRHFASGRDSVEPEATVAGETVPFGTDLLFEATNVAGLVLACEICEDLWAPIPPSTFASLAGATVIANLSASNVTIGKPEYRRTLCGAHSGACVAAYLYCGPGEGESTTDLAWDGHAMIWENGELLAESERFARGEQLVTADVDLDRLRQDRIRLTTYADCAGEHRERVADFRRVPFALAVPAAPGALRRHVARFPYVPSDPAMRDERCREVYRIQVQGLAKRLAHTGIGKLVIGVSGGLDSTQALLVAVKAMDELGRPRSDVLAWSMPGFATSERTRANATALMRSLGVTGAELDIRPSCLQMLRDLGHPYADGEPVYDTTFENVQAGERTSHLFRLANMHGGLVVGTGDLSEIALGWSTYGVGDQMSHYNVNASVPKTLVQHLLRWCIATRQVEGETAGVLQRILDTAISPELVPGEAADRPGQHSEATVGPYELQDFNLYFISRFGFRPSKVAWLAHQAWGDATRGEWPDLHPAEGRRAYDLATIVRWLEVFLVRFFQHSQFKRTASPNGPKVGSGGSLSPRGDWRAPSDAEAAVWLEELRRNVPSD